VRELTDEGVIALGECCPKLEILLLGGCLEITDSAVRSVASGCKKMRILGLGQCSRVTEEGLVEIGQLPNLEKLNLSCCPGVTDKALQRIADGCKYLNTLHLSGCSSVTAIGVSAVLEGCPGLVDIDISKCRRLAEKFLSSLEEKYTRLTIRL